MAGEQRRDESEAAPPDVVVMRHGHRRTTMDDELDLPEDRLLREAQAAAAAEAAAIGGRVPGYEWDQPGSDERWRPLAEAGEGVGEGFEQAEADLVEEAAHGDQRRDPEVDVYALAPEARAANQVYAEPDEIDPTEVVRDPREDADDPGAGPGIAHDR